MAVLDTPLRLAAKTILQTFGRPVTVTLQDKTGVYSTMTGLHPKADTTISTFALEVPVRGGFSPQKRANPAGTIDTSTKWLLPALDFTARDPRKDDVVTFTVGTGTEQYRIIEVLTHSTGELAGLHEVRLVR